MCSCMSQGAMLIIGGCCLHGLVGAALFRPITAYSDSIEEKKRIELRSDKGTVNEKELFLTTRNTTNSAAASLDASETQEQCHDESSKLRIQIDDRDEFTYVASEAGNSDASKPKATDRDASCNDEQQSVRCGHCSCVSTILSNPILIALVLVNFGTAFQQAVLAAFTPIFAMENGVSEELAFFLISWSGAADIVGRCCIGFAIDTKAIRSHIMVIACNTVGSCGRVILAL